MIKKGLFIIVDGPSASGKNSIIRQILKGLDKLNIKALLIEETKEKYYDREKILKTKKQGDKKTALTIVAERQKLYRRMLIPQLLKGALIIANRGEPSTLAYQTINRELTMENVWKMHRRQQIPLPDLAILTNCSVKEALRRETLREKSFAEKNENWMSGKFTSARKKIHANYKLVKDFLEKKSIAVIYLKTDTMNIFEESQKIVDFIKNKINYTHE